MKKKAIPVLVVCLLIALIAIAGVATHLIKKYTPSDKWMDLQEYYSGASSDSIPVILDTAVMEDRGFKAADSIYLPLDFVQKNLNQRFYWDTEGSRILYAEPSKLVRIKAGDPGKDHVTIADGQVYLTTALVEKYTNVKITFYQEPDRVVIQKQLDDIAAVTVKEDTKLRYRGGIKADILKEVEAGSTVYLIEEYEEWIQVMSEDGIIGFIPKKAAGEKQTVSVDHDFTPLEYTNISKDYKINLAWHQVTTQDANSGLEDTVKNTKGINTISPTWFSIKDNQGNITNIGSKEYVDKAHAMNIEVWGLVDNFSKDISTTEVLSSTRSRTNLIKQLVVAAEKLGLDGINIDFETLSEDAGIHFMEFLRELSIFCRDRGLVLSVDNPVPQEFTSHYDRAEQGKIVDYVIIMGYDEHYEGSEAGSVASLPWVEKGIQETLAEVPAHKVINGVPFFTRLWRTSSGIVTSEALGMEAAAQVIAENKVETYWDKTTSQNYGEYQVGNDTYQIWLEDSQSLAEKMKLIKKYDLAGVAEWKLGLENAEVWNVISENLK